jgi:hypothetical protein
MVQSPPLVPILSQMNPVHTIPPYFPNIFFNIIFPAGKDQLVQLNLNGKTVLQWFSNEHNVKVCSGLNWLGIVSSGGILWAGKGSIKWREFLCPLSNYQLLKDSSSWSQWSHCSKWIRTDILKNHIFLASCWPWVTKPKAFMLFLATETQAMTHRTIYVSPA